VDIVQIVCYFLEQTRVKSLLDRNNVFRAIKALGSREFLKFDGYSADKETHCLAGTYRFNTELIRTRHWTPSTDNPSHHLHSLFLEVQA
jgi:hypothetical protein